MLDLRLLRLTGRYDRGSVFGVLFVAEKLSFTTLEPPWLDNEKNKSCIPVNIYRCKRVDSPKFGLTYEVIDVPDRENILCGHVGNFVSNTQGCILIASGFMPNQKGISDSEKAVSLFRQIVKAYDSAILTIKWV